MTNPTERSLTISQFYDKLSQLADACETLTTQVTDICRTKDLQQSQSIYTNKALATALALAKAQQRSTKVEKYRSTEVQTP